MVNLGQLTDYAFYHLGHERVMGGVLGRKFQLEVIGNPEWIGEFEANEANWELANYQFALTTSPAGARLTKSNSAHSTRGVNIAQATIGVVLRIDRSRKPSCISCSSDIFLTRMASNGGVRPSRTATIPGICCGI